MSTVRWDWDHLLHRHLEGGLEEAQFRALNARLAEDAVLRRRLAELAFERAALAETAAQSVVLLKPRIPPRRKKRRKNEGRN